MTARLLPPLLLLALASCAATPPVGGVARVESFDGLEIAYEARGTGEPALVFIHGWCCNRGHWAEQMAVFGAERRVVAIDLAGHGESGNEREEWGISGLARDVEAVVEHLGIERAILVGHSMGGPVSLAAAARVPDRVIGVIGVDTLQSVEVEYTEEQIAPIAAALEADFPGAWARFVRGAFPEGADEELVERVASEAAEVDPRVAIGLLRSTLAHDFAGALAACPVPVRCVNTLHVAPTELEANRRYAPTFDVVLMEGPGHFPMLEAPEEFDAHLRRLIGELLGR